jgi:hypothetical protein
MLTKFYVARILVFTPQANGGKKFGSTTGGKVDFFFGENRRDFWPPPQ